MGRNLRNSSELPPFTLTGLPGLETSQHWMFLLLGTLYMVSITGNVLILFIIKEEQSLHQPMYYFLSLLSVNGLGVSFSTLPTKLRFCKANVLSHAYCLHPDLIRLPCGDITMNNIFGLFTVISSLLWSGLCISSPLLCAHTALCTCHCIPGGTVKDTQHMCVTHVGCADLLRAHGWCVHGCWLWEACSTVCAHTHVPYLSLCSSNAQPCYLFHQNQRDSLEALQNTTENQVLSRNHFNVTHPASFLLTGILGLESCHSWLARPLCVMYAVALRGNTMIIQAVRVEPRLHEPIYYFLSMLSFRDGACPWPHRPLCSERSALMAEALPFMPA
ncbi:hypothetical protein HPG69_005719 [Diceros bicornis minor]|uniref:G-protein coupled receptors family 1 profile domain-containing protein n=1 Tax=Diceros bicornis minor TaxID=77932 RepID=A0A7J7ESM0_DICBM|nr:hypothetical protein HPG69_005719 [Diceros bicornis minor]